MALLQSCFETNLQNYISRLNVIVNSTLTTTANELVLAAAAADQISPDRKSFFDIKDIPDDINYPNGTLIYIRNISTYLLTYNKCLIDLSGRLFSKRNELWGWGINQSGQLGTGVTDATTRSSPVREYTCSTDWSKVSAGNSISAGLKTNGQLWLWGLNNAGQLGIGNTISMSSPVREFCSATDWCQISVGNCHSAALKTNGQLWLWGLNANGQLGDGSTVNKCSPVREFYSATDWCQVSVGYFSSAIKTNGQLWSWGRNCYGQLGIGSSTTIGRCSGVREFCSATDWCQISVGTRISVGLKTSGQLWTWGENSLGTLGIGTTINSNTPVREFCSASDWFQVSTGRSSTAAINNKGELWTWGYNSQGILGDGTTINRCTPVREFFKANDWCQVSFNGFRQSSGIKTSGLLSTWGTNNAFASVNTCFPTVEACSSRDWSLVSSGSSHAIAIKITVK